MFRSIRVYHTNCLQVAIKTHSFIFIFVFHGDSEAEYKRTVTDTLKLSVPLPRRAYDGLRDPPCRAAEDSLLRGGSL